MIGTVATFYGSYTKVYLQYLDLSNYHCLVAVPGNTYLVGIASGWTGLSPVPGDGSWGAALPEFTAIPGLAEPGAFWPASPDPLGSEGSGEMDARDEVMEETSAAEEWAAEQVAVAARSDDPLYGEARDALAGAREKIAVLRGQQGRNP